MVALPYPISGIIIWQQIVLNCPFGSPHFEMVKLLSGPLWTCTQPYQSHSYLYLLYHALEIVLKQLRQQPHGSGYYKNLVPM